jgi:hypothetical protein
MWECEFRVSRQPVYRLLSLDSRQKSGGEESASLPRALREIASLPTDVACGKKPGRAFALIGLITCC